MRRICVVLGIVCALSAGPAEGRIKLITLPVRERVEIQLDHPDVTLVEEERIVPLVAGANEVDFSWANTAIDPSTIVFRVVPGEDGRNVDPKVVSVSYPPNEAALVWTVGARESGSARVRISYVLGGLSKSFNYRAVASHDEKTLVLSQYMRIQNMANEEFGESHVWAGFDWQFLKPIGINETRELLAARYANVPVTKTYTCDASAFGWLDRAQNKLMVPMHYVLHNDTEHNLGAAPLPFGKARIFQEDGRGGSAFLGEDWGAFTPVDDEMRLYLGVAQDIVVRRAIERNERKRVTGNLFHQEVVIKYEIENFKNQAVTLDVAENLRALRQEVIGHDTGRDVEWELGSQTTFAGGPDKEKTTFERVLLHASLPARSENGTAEKVVHKLHVILRNEW